MSPAKRRGNADWERRFRDRGGRHLSLRLSGNAAGVMDRLAAKYQCGHKDVIEGLLLGTIKPDAKLALVVTERLSDAEAAYL